MPPSTGAPHPLLTVWIGVLSSSNKTSSLKFALARALLDIAKAADSATEIAVPRAKLAEYFVEYFWFQTLVFRLRQSASENTAPLVLRHLSELEISPGQAARGPRAAPESQLPPIRANLVRSGFKYVLPCFHHLRHKKSAPAKFYEETRKGIVIGAEAAQFLRTEEPLLRGFLYFNWAKWLERFNTAPKIASKVAFAGERRRGSLRRWGRILAAIQPQCFYCPQSLTGGYEVDHVIPWAYLFEDPLWDLVLACPSCNRDKSATLPPRDVLQRLLARNEALMAGEKSMRDLLVQSYHSLSAHPEQTAARALVHLYDSAQADGF